MAFFIHPAVKNASPSSVSCSVAWSATRRRRMSEIEIVFSDHDIVVVNKPGGLLSVPGRGADKQDCVVNRLRHRFPEIIAQPAVHRLDMYTSGLLVVAVSAQAHRVLSRQFATGEVKKEYIAVIEGLITAPSGEIHLPFRLDPENRPYQIYDPVHGKMGISLWRNLGFEEERTRIEFRPQTGRTHQLRVHAAHHLGLGVPIVGDSLYGSGRDGNRMLLHASLLKFRHPRTALWSVFTSRPPF
jgi:tRNA pseudouridine32 synthase / 23S rRNA pseudouridine746 synthase